MNSKLNWTGERLVPSVLTEVAVEHLSRYALAIPYVKDKKVLDMACGEGYGSFILSEYATLVSGADIDHNTIAHAKKKYRTQNLNFVEADATALPFEDELFEVVVSFETIEHVERQKKMLEEIGRVLKKNGLLIISTPNKEVYSAKSGFINPFHVKELNKEEFSTLLKAYFTNVIILNQRNLYGSVIYSEESVMQNLAEMSGDYKQLIAKQGFHNCDYFVAIASNGKLPDSQFLFFSGENIFEERISALKKTWTYKIGNAVIAPLKWIRRLFNK